MQQPKSPEKLNAKVGSSCSACGVGSFLPGPFETKNGAFIYCSKCGHSISGVMDWTKISETTSSDKQKEYNPPMSKDHELKEDSSRTSCCEFSVKSLGKQHFDAAMMLAFATHNEASYYRISPTHGMILYSSIPTSTKEAIALPYKMKHEAAASFVWNWLKSVNFADFDKFVPCGDVWGEKGFRIFNETWGHVDNEWQAFVAIKPTFILFGK